MIRIQEVSKVFRVDGREVRALEDVSLTIPKGRVYGIIGLSGAGKSTLVRCINMLERPQSGKIFIQETEITALSKPALRSARKKIGMIFQHFNLLSSRTVAGNIAFPLEIAGVPKARIKARVEELLGLVGLSDKASSYPSQLSGGQKQRVGIARALANDPEVLLCDEATSALDPQTTRSILNLLKEINKRYEITMIVITHEMEVIKEICDDVAVIEEGRIIEEGPVLDVFTNPRTKTAKTFLRDVMKIEIPQEVIDRISHVKTSPGVYHDLVQVSFIGEVAGEPIISSMVKQTGAMADILYGNIDRIKDTPFGTLVLELLGSEEEVLAAKEYLAKRGLVVRRLTNGSSFGVDSRTDQPLAEPDAETKAG